MFSIERLEQHAESLAAAQRVTAKPPAALNLVRRLRENGRALLEAYRRIGEAIRDERAITPAAEWLVDNFHVVEEQIREIRDDLPRGFYRQLPKLAEGHLAGYPRVFGIAWAYVAHTDSRFDTVSLRRFVRAYQHVQPLTIGELWAVAITLRIVLVENLRRASDQIVLRRAARQEADTLTERLLGLGGHEAEPAEAVLEPYEKKYLPTAFAVQLVQRLRDQGPLALPALAWLDEYLARHGKTADEIVREEHQEQGALSVTVRNIITSMYLMSAVDWSELFESVSLIDDVLRAESNFGAMDFPTRDHYRHAIEDLARGSGFTELEVTRHALERAKRAAGESDPETARQDPGRQDPGYYLISKGRRGFESELGFRPPLLRRITRAYADAGIPGYLAIMTLISMVFLALALVGMVEVGISGPILVLLAFLALIPASDAAIALMNFDITNQFSPAFLPALELHDGIPAPMRTLVAVPTFLTSKADIEEQIDRLEVHFLANPGEDLAFALLSDWTDATEQHTPQDDELLAVAVEGIARLNERHGAGPGGRRFYLLHRQRLWNHGERKWMGWERKRGKLHELNRLLRGDQHTTFIPVGGEPLTAPVGVRYVLTLDADTRLPRGAARRLVGKAAHPLNLPLLDPHTARIVEGYAVLQPRVSPALPTGKAGSLFQRVFSGPGGMDPYALTVSDVYQDLLGEGSYTGKGIYDVDAFEAAMEGRIPENVVLSHDLLEGTFARAGLVTDVEVFEEFPARYDVAAARQHRWARGDWQLLPWIFGRGRDARKDPLKRTIPMVGRWKMLDNLRRTLSPPMSLLALLAGWMLPLPAAMLWSACIVALISLAALLPLLAAILPRRTGISKRSHLRTLASDFALSLSQIFLLVTLIAHQAWLMADAIVRTLVRLYITHQKMLEWVTAAQASAGPLPGIGESYHRMAGGIALAAAALFAVVTWNPSSWLAAVPFIGLWLLSPVIMQRTSRPLSAAGPAPLSADDAQTFRLIARGTWRFFETFVTPRNHMLPPDNFQEEPRPVVAHRTSPTNIGLYLLSAVAARDFGWAGILGTVERLEAAFATIDRLERFRGHLYNWYDTHDLRALDPKYISSVDSGNLAGHLIAVANACREMMSTPVLSHHWATGVRDALTLARELLASLSGDHHTQTVTQDQLVEALDTIATTLRREHASAATAARLLKDLQQAADAAVDIARTISEERNDAGGRRVLDWIEALHETITSHRRDIEQLTPWVFLLPADAPATSSLDMENGPPESAAISRFASLPALADLSEHCETAIDTLSSLPAYSVTVFSDDEFPFDSHATLIDRFRRSARAGRLLRQRVEALIERTGKLFDAMEFGFLFDTRRQLLSIGYRVADGTLDPNCYDLLASEARLASFIAIAKGDIPVRHWFRLGRSLTPVYRGSALISWSGSMFEYLMPSLVMHTPVGSLLQETCEFIVRRQMQYGDELGVPWGVSESAYNARDLEFTYQYSNFGVPGLGLKRGLSGDVVIAPYATALAAMIDPRAAAENFRSLAGAGARGAYGFYEALDYTRERLPEDAPVAVVRAYMAHHQGMTVVAIANTLHDGKMRRRFHAEPIIRATELLLQERTPRDVAIARPRAEEVQSTPNIRELVPPIQHHTYSAHEPVPRTHLLSNGKYGVMITSAGSGYSRWRDLAVTRWREDVTLDAYGTYVFLRDIRSGDVWSAGYQPAGVEPESYRAGFTEDRAEIVRHDGSIMTTLEVVVSPEDDGEVRRVSISNQGSRTREIELTSYLELVLAQAAADFAHPAFSKLFVITEYVANTGALLATRRRRSPEEPEVWAAHMAVVEGERVGEMQFETDRARFLGRGREIRNPLSMIDNRPLSGSTGAVLDPIFSLRCRLRIPPGATARVAFWTLIAGTREEVLDMADRHHDASAYERAVTMAWAQAQVQLHHLGIDPDEAHLYQLLANHVLYSDIRLRPSPDVLKRNENGQSALWPHGISGDVPIVVARVDEAENLEIVRQLLRAHQYWRMKLLAVDLVILNERVPSYNSDLQGALEGLLRAHEPGMRQQQDGEAAKGAIYILRADLVPLDTRLLIRSTARAVLLSRRGSLAEQLEHFEETEPSAVDRLRRKALMLLSREPEKRKPSDRPDESVFPVPEMEFYNGLGGFVDDGREYMTVLARGQWTPAPWVNVVANPQFGFQVSASGGCSTWFINSRQYQLSPWSNDPVSDRPGEVVYVRDDDSGEFWSPTALPIREEGGRYVARHGQGYSRFQNYSHDISLEVLQFVPLSDPIKISRVTIRNLSARSRHLSLFAYVEWVLGPSRSNTPFTLTEVDAETGALFARNSWDAENAGRVAFIDLGGRQSSLTGDRTEFLGRNGALDRPAALLDEGELSNHVGAGYDPCGAMRTVLRLGAHESAEVTFFLGAALSSGEARSLVRRYRSADLDAVLRTVTDFWDEMLGTLHVKTPDRSVDIMLNRWLLYQTLASRIWARSGFYQVSGAYGFRDQIQDVMALLVSHPATAREHLLRAGSRQFPSGDVQHWWLPPLGQGVRTRVSDDRIWLPYAVAQYIEVTADVAILDEMLPFLEGPVPRPGEHDAYFLPTTSEEQASLYEHCALALDQSLAVGPHRLPLIGTGDWNDGMNRVGERGSGESVWLGWFLFAALTSFVQVAEDRGDRVRASRWKRHAADLQVAIEREAWDGAWYRRGYYDDGTPLGSATSSECRIDAIAQSWGIISGGAERGRAAMAMAAVDAHLIRRNDGLILLFTPPFDKALEDPGYIKGYPPGVRENGGQYTHAAIWTAMAFAMMGDGDKAGELFALLNPINHTRTRSAVHRYKVEPYVIAADVYARPPHTGRGGWTWYSGSAGWMYRAGIEWILGIRKQGAHLVIDPCIPRAWPGFEVTLRFQSTRYVISVDNPDGVTRGVGAVEIDGRTDPSLLSGARASIPLSDDGLVHQIRILLGSSRQRHQAAASAS